MLTRYRWFAGTLARQSGREIRMVIDGTDPVAAAKPDGRPIKPLVRDRPQPAITPAYHRVRNPPGLIARP